MCHDRAETRRDINKSETQQIIQTIKMGASINTSLSFVLMVVMYAALGSAERPYSVVVEKVEITHGEGTFYKDYKIRVTKFNRTTAVVNGSFELMEDVHPDTMAKVVTYQKYGVQYQRSIDLPIQNFCKFIEEAKIVYPDIIKVSNLPEKCPIRKGTLFVKNYLLDEENFPEKIPPGDYWRIDVTLSLQEKPIFILRAYLHVQHYPQKLAFNRASG